MGELGMGDEPDILPVCPEVGGTSDAHEILSLSIHCSFFY